MIFRYGIPLSMAFVGQVATDFVEPTWMKYGSFGVVCAILLFIVVKQQPADRKAYTQSLEKNQKAFSESLSEIQDRMDGRNGQVIAQLHEQTTELKKQTETLAVMSEKVSRCPLSGSNPPQVYT